MSITQLEILAVRGREESANCRRDRLCFVESETPWTLRTSSGVLTLPDELVPRELKKPVKGYNPFVVYAELEADSNGKITYFKYKGHLKT